jgi:hypothetical protein
VLILGSGLLGVAAALALRCLTVEAKWAWAIGAMVGAGVLCIGLSLRAAFLP